MRKIRDPDGQRIRGQTLRRFPSPLPLFFLSFSLLPNSSPLPPTVFLGVFWPN